MAQRCRAYMNRSAPVPLPHTGQKGSLPQQGMSLPEKGADYSGTEEETIGNIGEKIRLIDLFLKKQGNICF